MNCVLRILATIILALSLTSCTKFKSIDVRCISYDGKSEVVFDTYPTFYGGWQRSIYLSFLYENDIPIIVMSSEKNEITFKASTRYDDAYDVSTNRGLRFTILPGMSHGIVSQIEDGSGKQIPLKEIPVLCFKAL